MAEQEGNKLFINGLPWATDDNSLYEKFKGHGNCTEAKVVYDRETGNSRGFGFVTFETSDEAQKAMKALDGSDMDGRYLGIKVAMPRAPREDSGFGGGERPKGVCYSFQKGTCTRGQDCRFSHEAGAAGAGAASTDERPCFDFQNKGSCSRGDGCRFSHTAKKANICFAFQKGDCQRGDDCRFEHGEANNAKTEEKVTSNANKTTFADSDDEAEKENDVQEEVKAVVDEQEEKPIESKKRAREEDETVEQTPSKKSKSGEFNWKKAIKSALKEGPKSMKKLRKEVLGQYTGDESDKKVLKKLFTEKLGKVKKAKVEGETVSLN